MLMLQGFHMRNYSNLDVTVHSADKCSNGQSCCQAWDAWMFQNIILEMEMYQFRSKNYALQWGTELPWQPLPYGDLSVRQFWRWPHTFFWRQLTGIIKLFFFFSYIIKGLETFEMYYEGNMVLVAHVVLVFGWIPRCCCVVEVFSGPKIRARPESTRITSYPNPTCINNNKKKINPTRDRPDEIRPESDPTRPHLFSNPTGPERKRHWRVHSLQPRIGPEKSCGPADLAAAPLLSFSLFTY